MNEYMRMADRMYDLENQMKQLEKENAELKKKCYKKAVKDYCKLEKENAKLRKDREELCHSISEGGKACVYLNEQLTNAKELLNEFMRISKASDEDFEHDYTELIAEAEQFLSEVDK